MPGVVQTGEKEGGREGGRGIGFASGSCGVAAARRPSLSVPSSGRSIMWGVPLWKWAWSLTLAGCLS